MPTLPPRADLGQLRRMAKERVRAARASGTPSTLAEAQLQLAREHGFPSWPALQLEVSRRRVLDLHDAAALAEFVARHPGSATADMQRWLDHPLGASPLGYVAMARYDTAAERWRDVEGTAAAAHVLLANGAAVDGMPGDTETPLITAASYGDADVAAVLIAAGADLDALAAPNAGGVPNGSALLHAAVFGMTDVLDVLVAAGARIRSIEEAAAAGDVTGWLTTGTDEQARIRSLVMAADHQRVGVIDTLIAAGTPVDVEDAVFHRHPLRLAAMNGRPRSVEALIAHGADPGAHDGHGMTALDHCRRGRGTAASTSGHDEVEAILTVAPRPPSP